MDCDALSDRRLLLAEGEAGGDPALEAHLESCDACRADVEEMRDVRRLYRAAATEGMPDRVRARALSLRPARPSRWARLAPAAVAALLLAALIVPFLAGPGPAPAPNPAAESWNPPEIQDVRERLLEPEARRPLPPPEPGIDRQIRELRLKARPLTLDEW